MGDVFKPTPMKTGQQKAGDTFSKALDSYMQGKTPMFGGMNIPPAVAAQFPELAAKAPKGTPGPATLGEFLQMFNMPGYEGDLSTGMTKLQSDAQGYGTKALADFFAPGGGNDQLSKSLEGIMSVDDVYSALDSQRKQSLARSQNDLGEQFGVAGLGDSTSQFESATRQSTESEQNLMAEVARIAPQLIEATSSAAATKAGIPMGVATAGFNLGEGARQIDQQGLDRMYQEFIRQNSSFLPYLMQFLGGGGPVDYAPSPFSQATQGAATVAAFL